MGLAQQRFGGGPVDAGVGDGLAGIEQGRIGLHGLVAAFEVAFEHEAADGAVAGFELRRARRAGRRPWRSCFLPELPWVQSTMMFCGRWASRRAFSQAATLAAS